VPHPPAAAGEAASPRLRFLDRALRGSPTGCIGRQSIQEILAPFLTTGGWDRTTLYSQGTPSVQSQRQRNVSMVNPTPPLCSDRNLRTAVRLSYAAMELLIRAGADVNVEFTGRFVLYRERAKTPVCALPH